MVPLVGALSHYSAGKVQGLLTNIISYQIKIFRILFKLRKKNIDKQQVDKHINRGIHCKCGFPEAFVLMRVHY